jgi:integrase/recombinase XerC
MSAIAPVPDSATQLDFPPPSGSSLVERLLADKRSAHTQKAYAKDLKDFFRTTTGCEPTPEMVAAFLRMERLEAKSVVLDYKAKMIDRGLSEATVNRRLAAIRALVNYAYEAGQCDWTLSIRNEKVKPYRDTTGISREAYRQVLAVLDRETLKGKRDFALLRLLWDNALRRGEVSNANIKHFDPEARTLKIYGKGKGTQAESIDLSRPTTAALLEWLETRGEASEEAPLFIALDYANFGHRLTGSAIAWIVKQTCLKAGITKPMSPHRIRHSSITAALDATNGNVRKVQKLSRHAQLDTLMIYDDNRQKWQLEITDLLAEML